MSFGDKEESDDEFANDTSEDWKKGVDPDNLASLLDWEPEVAKLPTRGRWYELEHPHYRNAIPVEHPSYLTARMLGDIAQKVTISRGKCMGKFRDCAWYSQYGHQVLSPHFDPNDFFVFIGIPEERQYARRTAYFAFMVHCVEVGNIVPHS